MLSNSNSYEKSTNFPFYSEITDSVRLSCQPTSQHYFSLAPNQHRSPASQHYFSLTTNQHQPPATSRSQSNRVIIYYFIVHNLCSLIFPTKSPQNPTLDVPFFFINVIVFYLWEWTWCFSDTKITRTPTISRVVAPNTWTINTVIIIK